MLEGLPQTAVDASSDEQQPLRRGMLEQCKMHGFLGGFRVRDGGKNQTVFVKAARALRIDNCQVAITRVTNFDQSKALPKPMQRVLLYSWHNLNRDENSNTHHPQDDPASPRPRLDHEPCGGEKIQTGHDTRDLESGEIGD